MRPTPATERELEAIYVACERAVNGGWPGRRNPRATLERLAAAVAEDARPDWYGEGDLVERLERRVADLLGKESAAFFVSGTMAQQIALRIHADRRGLREVAYHATSHLRLHEQAAAEHLHDLHAVVAGDRHRLLDLAGLEAIEQPLAALLLELPQRELGGVLPEWEDLVAQTDWARERGVALHLDGARLWEAQPYYDRPLDEIAGLFDSAYVSFYKGLAGLAGCVLAGRADLIAEARVWRVRHGGRLPSVYPFTLAAELGLDHYLPRMGDFYRHAVAVGGELDRRDELAVAPSPPQTPLLHVFIRGDRDRLVDAALELADERGIWLFGRLGDTPLPGHHLLELQISDPGLEFTHTEIGELFDEVLARAA